MGAKLSDDQQDVVALLTGELAELVEQDMVAVIAEGGDLWREEVSAVSQHLEHVGNAAELAGLPGLAACCHHLATNFSGLAGAAGIPSDDCLAVLPFWGIYLLGYLQAVGDDDLRPQAAADLLMLLSDLSLIHI